MNSNSRELICISCPMGCHLDLRFSGDIQDVREGADIEVRGNRCPRGDLYAREELLRPRRTVTATVFSGEHFPRIPVKSSSPVPRGDIPSVLNDLYQVHASLPVTCGQVIAVIRNIEFVATRSFRNINEE